MDSLDYSDYNGSATQEFPYWQPLIAIEIIIHFAVMLYHQFYSGISLFSISPDMLRFWYVTFYSLFFHCNHHSFFCTLAGVEDYLGNWLGLFRLYICHYYGFTLSTWSVLSDHTALFHQTKKKKSY